MNDMHTNPIRVAIVGTGNVGSTLACASDDECIPDLNGGSALSVFGLLIKRR